MGFNALWVVLAVLLGGALWLLLRRPKPKGRVSSSRKFSPVSKSSSKGAESAELPVFESEAVAAPEDPTRELPKELRGFHLVMQKEIDEVTRGRVESICNDMPEPHPVQRQLAGGLDTPDDLAQAVASDAGLTANVLRTVNSAAFSLASPITSVQHAITYLGVNVVKGVVAQAALVENQDEGPPEQQAALARIWKSACTASALAQMLGQEVGVERPSVLATKALFFNLGDVALVMSVENSASWYTDGVTIVQRIAGQQAACSVNAAIIGASLANLWHLPADIGHAIEYGFVPLFTPPNEHPMVGTELRENVLMYLAGRIGDRVSYRGLKDIAELNLVDSDEPGLFYLPEHLASAGLGRVPELLQSPAFRRKANRVLATLNG